MKENLNRPQRPNIRQDLYDPNGCVCVPYQYCSMNDVVDRRESIVDVVLPLDPRNNGEEDDAILADDEKPTDTPKTKREAKDLGEESEGVSSFLKIKLELYTNDW